MAVPSDPSIVVLTGAGISRESGLETFRDKDGIWAKVRLEDYATPDAFARDPARVQGFYDQRRRQLLEPAVQPNAAHRALAGLERALSQPGLRPAFLLVTQNIDDLHERAGSGNLVHMHGELLKARCTGCDRISPVTGDLGPLTACVACGAPLRPHVVWFGEMPLAMAEIYRAIGECDVFLSIGTSGTVYPAAGFVQEARAAGAHTVELNLEPSDGRSAFAECIYGQATEVVPAYVERLLAEIAA